MPKTLISSSGVKNIVFLFFAMLLALNSSTAQNAIVTENLLPGNPISEWGVDLRSISGILNLNGYATDISVNQGGTVHFKIDDRWGVDMM